MRQSDFLSLEETTTSSTEQHSNQQIGISVLFFLLPLATSICRALTLSSSTADIAAAADSGSIRTASKEEEERERPRLVVILQRAREKSN